MNRRLLRFKRIMLLTLVGIFSFSGISGLMGGVFNSSVFALGFQQDIGVSFTFNPMLRLTLSSADIYINELAPGTASDSNIITVNVVTNTANGYTLNATVGNDTTFVSAGRDLIHENSTVTEKFTSVDFGSSFTSNTDLADNTWAYSYLDESLNNGTNTTWSNYSGLPLYSDTTNVATLKTSTTPVTSTDGDKIKFKIAAKASNTMPSGEYNNVINFTVVATPIPKTLSMAYADAGKTKYNGYYKMQDMTTDICNATEVIGEGSVTELIDIRDNTVYTATKLADNKCWMTKNLRLDFSNPAVTITAENTNGPTAEFTSIVNDQHPSSTPIEENGWCSRQPGVEDEALVIECMNRFAYNTVNIGDTTTDSRGVAYDEYGVYYNYYTATAGYGKYEMASGTVAGDICPFGWRLPTGGAGGDFYVLAKEYAGDSLDNINGLINSPAKFVFSGFALYNPVDHPNLGRGLYAPLWSDKLSNNVQALNFGISDLPNNKYINPGTGARYKYTGLPIRCIVK